MQNLLVLGNLFKDMINCSWPPGSMSFTPGTHTYSEMLSCMFRQTSQPIYSKSTGKVLWKRKILVFSPIWSLSTKKMKNSANLEVRTNLTSFSSIDTLRSFKSRGRNGYRQKSMDNLKSAPSKWSANRNTLSRKDLFSSKGPGFLS